MTDSTAGAMWCLGMAPQPPHLTDGGLIQIGEGRHLCRPCWHRWRTARDPAPPTVADATRTRDTEASR